MYAISLNSPIQAEKLVQKAKDAVENYIKENGTAEDAVLIFSVVKIKNEATLQRKD